MIGALVSCLIVDESVRSHAVCRVLPCVVLAVDVEDWGAAFAPVTVYTVRAQGHPDWTSWRVWARRLTPPPPRATLRAAPGA